MQKKNSENADREDLKNIFTAYVTQAVRRCRQKYIARLLRYREREFLREEVTAGASFQSEDCFMESVPTPMQMENDALMLALRTLSRRERDIILSHILEDKSFLSLAKQYATSRNSVAAVYYRTLRKIKKQMEESDEL